MNADLVAGGEGGSECRFSGWRGRGDWGEEGMQIKGLGGRSESRFSGWGEEVNADLVAGGRSTDLMACGGEVTADLVAGGASECRFNGLGGGEC